MNSERNSRKVIGSKRKRLQVVVKYAVKITAKIGRSNRSWNPNVPVNLCV